MLFRYSWAGVLAPDSNALCNIPCAGDASEICGGPNRLDLFSLSSGSAEPTTDTVWAPLGCYTDGNLRTLPAVGQVPGGGDAVTIETCQATCQSAGYILAGVEYAGERYCGNILENGGGPAPDGDAQCNMPCKGNKQEICGSPFRLNLYSIGSLTASTPTASTSTTSTPTASSSTTSTTTTSQGTCTAEVSTVTIPASTITIPASTVTLPASTVTLPTSIITITLPASSIAVTLPASTITVHDPVVTEITQVTSDKSFNL